MADIRLRGETVEAVLKEVDKLSEQQMTDAGLSKAVWETLSSREKLMQLVQLSLVNLNRVKDADGD